MAERRSYWTSVVVAGLLALPGAVAAQADDLDALCADAAPGVAPECRLAEAAVRMIQPRVGLGLWGGSTVPGSASTLGMRLGSLPRFSTSGRITLVPMELPPLMNRSVTTGARGLATSLSGQTTVGLLTGWSPLPTVGGVLSLDATARVSWLLLPEDPGFDERSVFGGSVGLRLGLLRESFTLPGVSITGAYGRSTSFGYGDAAGGGRGHIEGGVASWSGRAAATKRIGPVGLTGGASYTRYTSDVEVSYGGVGDRNVPAATDRWAAFGNVSWTLLVFHASLEAGWQETADPVGLPADVSVDPVGWWLGAAFRLSI